MLKAYLEEAARHETRALEKKSLIEYDTRFLVLLWSTHCARSDSESVFRRNLKYLETRIGTNDPNADAHVQLSEK